MGRRIVTTQLQSSRFSEDIDSYPSKIIKYIPSDIVAAWVAATNIMKSDTELANPIWWIALGIGIVLTAAWTLKQTQVPGKPPAITQTIISTIAFVVWVFALGEPFSSLSFYRYSYASLILILYMLIVPLVPLQDD